MQAIIFCGIQGSGKSTFYKQHFFNSHIRISLDLLKTRNRERLLLKLCFTTNARFVIDNTNPTVAERLPYIEAAKAARYEIIGYFFDSNLDQAIANNLLRSGKEVIPEKGIRSTYHRLQPPMPAEGFHQLYRVKCMPNTGSLITKEFPFPEI